MKIPPRALRCHRSYPILTGEDVINCSFVRETKNDFYASDNLIPKDLIRTIIPSDTSSADIFEFSVYLYGYYNEKHMGIRNKDALFPLFLRAKQLYDQHISNENECFILSFSHCQTDMNYWHFQLFTMDSNGEKIPRNTKKRRDKNLAKFIVREYIQKAICQKSEVVPFRRDDYDKRIRPIQYFFKSCGIFVNKGSV